MAEYTFFFNPMSRAQIADHLLLSPQAADRMTTSGIDRFTRGWEKPSDHVPAWVELR